MVRRNLLIVIVLIVLAGAGLVGYKLSNSTTTTTTTTTTIPVPIAPLTGLADPSGFSQTHPALTVKIENIPEAMPQRGIDHADVIYEEIVEGCITRLAAVFNSHAPAQIGPIRSVRRTDREIVWPIGGIFAYSGGAAYAVSSILTAPVHTVDETQAGSAMFRDNNGRVAPNNLYGYGPRLFAVGGHPSPPPALFTYRTAHQVSTGTPVVSVNVGFTGGYAIQYHWNSSTASWDRVQFGVPDVTVDGVRMSPKNVIVMAVAYTGGVCQIGAEAKMTGSGKATVFSDGRVIKGTWTRSSFSQVTKYVDSKGHVIALTPGQTIVELLYTGDALTWKSPVVKTPHT